MPTSSTHDTAEVGPHQTGRPEVTAGGSGTEADATGTPAAVWWITGLYLVVLVTWSLLLPTYRSPDEPLHVSLSHQFSEEQTYPAWDQAGIDEGILRSLPLVRFRDDSEHLTDDEATPRGERPSIEELQRGDPPRGINQLTQHPPLYYVATGGAMWGLEALFGDPIGGFDLEVWLYRLAGVLIVAPLPLIIWRTTGHLSLPAPVRYAAMLFPLAIPQFTHIASTANNDSLSLVLLCAVTPVAVRIGNGALGPRTAALAGLLTGLGLLTKAFAIVAFVWVLVALAIAARRGGRDAVRPAMVSAAVFGAVSLAAGGWWWVRNIVLYGEVAPSRFGELVPPDDSVQVNLREFLRAWAYDTTQRFWGEFGWFETGLPEKVVLVATVLTLVAVALAVVRRDRVASIRWGTRALLLVPLALLVAGQFAQALNGYRRTGEFTGMQGRYWFGALAVTSVLVAIGLSNLVRSRLSWVPGVVLAAVAVMQGLGIVTCLSFYWGPPGSGVSGRLRSLAAWVPLPNWLLAAGALLTVVVVAGILRELVRLVRSDRRQRGRQEPAAPVPTTA